MAAVYSKLLWSQGPLSVGTTYWSPPVPAGFVWIVRDQLLWNHNPPDLALSGIVLGDNEGGILGGVWEPEARGLYLFHRDMRQVLEPGMNISARTSDANWYLRISGYELSLP